jgi:replicative DNA helicase
MVSGDLALVDSSDWFEPGPEDTMWEVSVLAAILQGFPDVGLIRRYVTSNDFAHPANAAVWDAITAMDDENVKPTMTMVVSRMGNEAHRLLPGGPLYLHRMVSAQEVLPYQAEHYAAKLRTVSMRRQIRDMGLRSVQMVQDVEADPEEFLDRMQAWVDQARTGQVVEAQTAASVLEQVIDIAEHGQDSAPTTAWSDLDELIGGWYPKALTIVGARPGTGKSLFLENAATDLTRRHGVDVLFISLEMSRVEIVQRTTAHTARVPLTALRAGRGAIDETMWGKIQTAGQEMQGDRVFYVDKPGQSLSDVRREVIQAQRQAKRDGRRLAMVAIDYVGRMRARDQRVSRQQQIGEIVDGLKDIAGEFDLHVLLAAQLNRNGEARQNKQPMLADLRESGDLEQTADNVILLHEEEIVDDHGKLVKSEEVQVIVAKQRNGPTGIRTLQKWGHYACLRQMARPGQI